MKRENFLSPLVDKGVLIKNLLKTEQDTNGYVLYVCSQLLNDFHFMEEKAIVNSVAKTMMERYVGRKDKKKKKK